MRVFIKLFVPIWVLAVSVGSIRAQDAANDAIQETTNNVLTALGGVSATAAIPEVTVSDDLIGIIGQAMADGKSDDYINTLINEAHSEGQIAVPDSMTDSEGLVDSAAMLSAVVNAAIAAKPTTGMAALQATTDSIAASGVDVISHKVRSGDTLARIARKYYGNTGTYQKILDANPEISNANLIEIGMVLRIP